MAWREKTSISGILFLNSRGNYPSIALKKRRFGSRVSREGNATIALENTCIFERARSIIVP